MDVDMYIEAHLAMVTCGFMTKEQQKKTAIKIVKSMYRNVNAAIKSFKTLTTHLTDKNRMSLMQSKEDPCVFLTTSF